MSNAGETDIFDLSEGASVETLMSRIRAHLNGSAPVAAPAPAPAVEAAGSGVELDHLIVRALSLIERDLRQTHTHAAALEQWLQDETEQNAQDTHKISVQLTRLCAQLDALDQRLSVIEARQL